MKKQDVIDAVTNNSLDLIKKPGRSGVTFLFGAGGIRTNKIPEPDDYRENYVILKEVTMGYTSVAFPFNALILEYDKIIGIAFG